MGSDLNFDARDTRDGGWSWFQQELLYVFTPLIGTHAAWLYTVMCHLIPQKIEHPLMELSIRTICSNASMAVGTVHREMRILTAIGMIEKTPGEPGGSATYRLVSLRALAAEGTAELVKRLQSVPEWNTSKERHAYFAKLEGKSKGKKSRATGSLPAQTSAEPNDVAASASEGSDEEGVPAWNTNATTTEKPENDPKLPEKDPEVFQKPGGSVPEIGGSRSRNGGVAFQESRSLFKSIYLEKELPPTPVPGEGGLILPFDECRPGEPGWTIGVGVAARWVLAVCGISAQSMERVVVAALKLRAETTGESLHQVALLASRNFVLYQRKKADGALRIQWGIRAFFGEGHWQVPETWPYNAPAAKLQQASGVGYAMFDEAGAVRDAQEQDAQIASFIEANAKRLDAVEGCAIFAIKLRQLGSAGLEMVELDEELQLLELLLGRELATECPAEEVSAIRKKVEAKVAHTRMTNELRAKYVEERIGSELIVARGLPRLGLFFMRAL